MGKLLIAVAGLVLGLVGGAFGALSLGGGAMMGAGVATGLSAGVCATFRAAIDMAKMSSLPPDESIVGGAAVLDELNAEAGQ